MTGAQKGSQAVSRQQQDPRKQDMEKKKKAATLDKEAQQKAIKVSTSR